MTISLVGRIFVVCVTKTCMRLSYTSCQNCQILNSVRPSDDDNKVVDLLIRERRQKLELSLGDSCCFALVTSER